MIKKIKIILRENKRLINEITMEQAMVAINSKATKKQFQGCVYEYYSDRLTDEEPPTKEEYMSFVVRRVEKLYPPFIELLPHLVPKDLQNEEKALSLIWIKKVLLSAPDFIGTLDTIAPLNNLKRHYELYPYYLERFFILKNFIEPREFQDLNKIPSLKALIPLIDDARERYKANQEKQAFLDADKGTEKLGESGDWEIFIAHNKGAACKLGKGTDWCTAAPGLDYFAQYSKEDDPLFIFISKSDPKEKYQFHYGSTQFMNKMDEPADASSLSALHKMLVNIPNIKERYPILNNFVQTGLGLSKKQVVHLNDGRLSHIRYFDVRNKNIPFAGDLPQIHINYIRNEASVSFEWRTSVEDERDNVYMGRKNKPAVAAFRLNNNNVSNITFAWAYPKENSNTVHGTTAILDDGKLEIRDKEKWKHFEKYYLDNIKGKEAEYCLELVKTYLPPDFDKVKNKND